MTTMSRITRTLSAATALTLMALTAPRAADFIFVIDDESTKGSVYFLSSFDNGSGVLTMSGAKGTFVTTLGSETIFRDAKLDKYAPTDPCRNFAADYNTAGMTGDTNGLPTAITSLASNTCKARILFDRSVPPNPIRSFRPVS